MVKSSNNSTHFTKPPLYKALCLIYAICSLFTSSEMVKLVEIKYRFENQTAFERHGYAMNLYFVSYYIAFMTMNCFVNVIAVAMLEIVLLLPLIGFGN